MRDQTDIAAYVAQVLSRELIDHDPDPDPDGVEKRVQELQAQVDDLLERVGVEDARDKAAVGLVDLLTPTMIDVRLWRELANGRNIHLPASDQFGPVAARLMQPEQEQRRGRAGSNAYGRVHGKGGQAPSAFLKRQGEFLAANARRLAQAEQAVSDLKQERAEIDHGLKLYALTALLTAVRKDAASIFALGPATTLLRAIDGPTGEEIVSQDRSRDTKVIMTVLHALRANTNFQSELKNVILVACRRYAGAAASSERAKWDFEPEDLDYLERLAELTNSTFADLEKD